MGFPGFLLHVKIQPHSIKTDQELLCVVYYCFPYFLKPLEKIQENKKPFYTFIILISDKKGGVFSDGKNLCRKIANTNLGDVPIASK